MTQTLPSKTRIPPKCLLNLSVCNLSILIKINRQDCSCNIITITDPLVKYNWVFLYFIHMTTILINSVSVSYISILCRAKFCLVCLSRQLRNSTQAKKNSKNSKNFARLNRWTVYGIHRRAKFGRTKFIYLVCWIAFRFYIIELNSLDKQLHWAGYLAYLI